MILVPAIVLKREHKSYVVKLFDGYGEVVTPVHQKFAIPWAALRKRRKKA